MFDSKPGIVRPALGAALSPPLAGGPRLLSFPWFLTQNCWPSWQMIVKDPLALLSTAWKPSPQYNEILKIVKCGPFVYGFLKILCVVCLLLLNQVYRIVKNRH